MKVKEIYEFINEIAPFELAESWDNCGLLIGGAQSEVNCVMPVLDVTLDVIKEAYHKNVDLIISHHPVIFEPLKAISDESVVFFAVKHGINVICAHTNLDMAKGGVTDALANLLGLSELKILNVLGENGAEQFGEGAVGRLNNKLAPQELAARVKTALGCAGVKLVLGNRDIETVALANGSESGMLEYAKRAGADALVAGETKYNVMIDAKNAGITLIDAGHFETENIIVDVLEKRLKERFEDLAVIHSGSNICPYKIV